MPLNTKLSQWYNSYIIRHNFWPVQDVQALVNVLTLYAISTDDAHHLMEVYLYNKAQYTRTTWRLPPPN